MNKPEIQFRVDYAHGIMEPWFPAGEEISDEASAIATAERVINQPHVRHVRVVRVEEHEVRRFDRT